MTWGSAKPVVLTETFLHTVHDVLSERFRRGGAHIERFYYCPHDPHAPVEQYRRDCTCRKPQPGMVLQAADDLGIDLTRSFVVGDKWSDVQLAKNAGCHGLRLWTAPNVDFVSPLASRFEAFLRIR